MANSSESQVSEIRAASRRLVRELGFMSRNIAGTDLSPSAVHAIVEIGMSKTITSSELGMLLLLEKSSVSRLVKSLIKKKLVIEKTSKTDARVKFLCLTGSGVKMLKNINTYAENKVLMAIEPLNSTSRKNILSGLQEFSLALEVARQSK